MGTVINVLAVIAGGVLGLLFGRFLKEGHQETLTKTCGICVIFIGIAGAMEGMLAIDGGKLVATQGMFVTICLALGALIGETIDIEKGFEKFGSWLKIKTGNAKDKTFVDAFVTSTITICIGAMAIVGALEDGLSHDYSILMTKSILDMIIIMIMTASMGKGSIFAAIPVGLFQGSITILARFLKPVMTDTALANLSFVGSILIFCVGVNLFIGKKIKVANLLPGVFIAVGLAFI